MIDVRAVSQDNSDMEIVVKKGSRCSTDYAKSSKSTAPTLTTGPVANDKICISLSCKDWIRCGDALLTIKYYR